MPIYQINYLCTVLFDYMKKSVLKIINLRDKVGWAIFLFFVFVVKEDIERLFKFVFMFADYNVWFRCVSVNGK